MNKLVLATAVALVGWAQASLAEVQCTTSSRGRQYTARGWDENQARRQVVEECSRDYNADRRECDRNVSCYGDNGGGDHGGGYGGGSISASPQSCYVGRQGTCTVYIQFNMHSDYDTGIATVIDPSTGQEKVFACHQGRSPMNPAPWIQRGSYTFNLYSVRSCYDSIYGARRVDSVTVYGQ